jgi:hypothetical protein
MKAGAVCGSFSRDGSSQTTVDVRPPVAAVPAMRPSITNMPTPPRMNQPFFRPGVSATRLPGTNRNDVASPPRSPRFPAAIRNPAAFPPRFERVASPPPPPTSAVLNRAQAPARAAAGLANPVRGVTLSPMPTANRAAGIAVAPSGTMSPTHRPAGPGSSSEPAIGPLSSARISLFVRRRPSLFGGGREDAKVVGRRIRWVGRSDELGFAAAQRFAKTHLWDLCRRCAVEPGFATASIDRADALVVGEDMVPVVDPATGRIVPAKPLMPPNTSLQLNGFVTVRLDPAAPRALVADVICTAPGRSQAKALLTFLMQRAKDLGYAAIRLGNSRKAVPVARIPAAIRAAANRVSRVAFSSGRADMHDGESRDADDDGMNDGDSAGSEDETQTSSDDDKSETDLESDADERTEQTDDEDDVEARHGGGPPRHRHRQPVRFATPNHTTQPTQPPSQPQLMQPSSPLPPPGHMQGIQPPQPAGTAPTLPISPVPTAAGAASGSSMATTPLPPFQPAGASTTGAAYSPTLRQRPQTRPRLQIGRDHDVRVSYYRLMRYLESQSLFQPKCGGHLLEFFLPPSRAAVPN